MTSRARVFAAFTFAIAALLGTGARAQSSAVLPSGAVTVEVVSPKIRKVTFANPPANLIGPATVSRLRDVVKELGDDDSVQVVIFASATPKFFFNHFDLRQASQFPMVPGDDTTPAWVDLVLRLSRAPFVSIAQIRGRTRGGGNELALAMDLRYASREQALFSQPEVGTGIVPGGGGSERLPRLIGRDRALEAILGSQDYDADTAERYGWVTRTVADAELDRVVDAMAARLASFDRPALMAAKAQVNRATLPPDADLRAAYAEYSRSLANPGFPSRMTQLGRAIGEKGLDVELRLGDYLGAIKPTP
ncbi:enoyl-CoA hydratase/isomerase family protein [Ottowia thiooxydans]|uniref:enoyl-CoA hydratase/isomerase family protein n=1 Tax=Ottowia thiooxydans TaxID=219182 RepID=UPI000A071240|nr:enoyl-CoA hydratase/isomerase family protein [Ottowia thiooxydans]